MKQYCDIYYQIRTRLYSHFNYQADKSLLNEPKSQTSPYLNVYGYPNELDYRTADNIPLRENFVNLETFCRDEENDSDLDVSKTKQFLSLPEQFKYSTPTSKLIYFSLGTLLSMDIELIKRLLAMFATTPHRYIVSKGLRADEFELPDNCWGGSYLDQIRIIQLVDLVITHGGNNTVTETFNQGKPMIVMPSFLDQWDNAQRVQEKGYGIWLHPFLCTKEQITQALDRLLTDSADPSTDLYQKLSSAKNRMTDRYLSKERVCERIEQMIQDERQRRNQQ